jgi:two-component system, NarL family, sensor histidine kinase EvgS
MINQQTILVAEDSDLMRFVTRRQLASLGAACEGARDGEEALQMWRREPWRYWLLLTDIEMPRMSGLDLARAIRSACSAGARLPIVAYSGKTTDAACHPCRQAGIDDCLAKPAELHRLRGVLQRWRPRTSLRLTGT